VYGKLTSVVLLVVILFWLPARGQEEGDIDDEFRFLEEAMEDDEVKSASKHRQSIFWSPSAITVLTREDIRSSGANVLPDLFRRVAGIDVMDITYGFQVVGARALTDESCNLILALIDGREALLEIAGITMWLGLTIDVEEIDRIEIIRGPGSALYGANAYAGVINIIPVSDKSEDRKEINIAGGERGYFRVNGILREHWKLGEGELSLQLMLSNQAKRSSSDPAMLNYLPYRTHGVLRYRLGKLLDVSLQGGMHNARGRWYTHVGDMRFWDGYVRWAMAQGNLALGESARLKAQVYHTSTGGTFAPRTGLSAFNVWIADFPEFVVTFPSTDGQLQLDLQLSEDLLLMTGANLRYLTVESQQFDPTFFDEIRAAGFIQAQLTIAELIQLSGGLRLDYSNKFDLAISPRFVAVYRPREDLSLRAGYGLAFRKPSLYESHAHFTVESHNPATPEIVEKLRESLGNENLNNEKVHSFEVGSRAHFLQNRLRLTLDLYFNIYLETNFFFVDLTQSMGMPNIRNSTIRYENDSDKKYALGGEFEILYQGGENWQVWGNLGLRRVTSAETGEREPSEPVLRTNLGARYSLSWGLRLDLALHYVSSHSFPFADPRNLLNDRELQEVGDNFMLVSRLGYYLPIDEERSLEAGFTIRAPLGAPFREFPGTDMPFTTQRGNAADWGGETLHRWVVLYLRGIF
jgi:iron complex outermembrane receptor protein